MGFYWERLVDIVLTMAEKFTPNNAASKRLQKPCPLLKMLQKLQRVPCNPQLQSPLFSKIPPEIRNQIFAYVLAEQDVAAEIPEYSYWYRPDYTRHRYIDVALLRTCRKTWLETYALPRINVTERIWLGWLARRPARILTYIPSASETELYGKINNRTSRLWPCETVQVFAQMWALEQTSVTHMNLRRLCEEVIQREILPVRRLILTIRYTDWWEWENDQSLYIADHWHGVNQIPESVEEVVLELETRNGKKAELEEIVNRQLRHWTFRGVSGLAYPLDESRITRSTWLGSRTPGGSWREHHLTDVNCEGKMLYYVVKMFWTKMEPLDFRYPNMR